MPPPPPLAAPLASVGVVALEAVAPGGATGAAESSAAIVSGAPVGAVGVAPVPVEQLLFASSGVSFVMSALHFVYHDTVLKKFSMATLHSAFP